MKKTKAFYFVNFFLFLNSIQRKKIDHFIYLLFNCSTVWIKHAPTVCLADRALFFALEKIVRVYIKFTDKNTSVRVTWGARSRAILHRSDWGRSGSQGNHDSYPSSGINSRTVQLSTTKSPHWRESWTRIIVMKDKSIFFQTINNYVGIMNDKYFKPTMW